MQEFNWSAYGVRRSSDLLHARVVLVIGEPHGGRIGCVIERGSGDA